MKTACNRILHFIVVLLLLPGVALAEPRPLQIGIVPTLSPRLLLKNYEYVRRYLARELRQPMILGTATDFKTFHSQTMADEYDVIVTAAHLGRLAQREKGWLPLATYQLANRAILLVSNNPPIHSIEDLRGKSITSLDPIALVVIQGRQWLSDKGLRQSLDYQYVNAPGFTSAVYAVVHQQAALAIVSPAGYKQLSATLKAETHIFHTLPEIPALIWLVNPKSQIDAARLRTLLLNFTPEVPEGREFFQATGYEGMRAVTEEQMRSLDVYADQVRPLLNAPR